MKEVHSIRIDGQTVIEAARTTPVAARVDVLVVGNGPAGVVAAIAAAREGASVLVVERHGMLNGVWTAGLLKSLFDPGRKGYVVDDLVQCLKNADAWRPWPDGAVEGPAGAGVFDIEAMKVTFERLADDAGVTC